MKPLKHELLQLLEQLDDYQVRLVISFVRALFN
jgi:hypothetical protein